MSEPTTNTGGNLFLERVYLSKNHDELRSSYADWAATYEQDVLGEAQGYVAPALIAEHVRRLKGSGDASTIILDAGCGTGLVGVNLRAAGCKATIDGIDLSPSMLEIARKSGVYGTLDTADLSKPISKKDNEYDMLTCSGTLTHGHVGPHPALSEFVRVIKKDGIVIVTILEDIWEPKGYKAEVELLKEKGLVEVLSAESEDYRRGAGVKAIMLIMRKS